MWVISRKTLREFWQQSRYADSREALASWFKVAERASWASIRDVRQVYRSADAVPLDCDTTATVFNIRGNKYRLITIIHYPRVIFVKRVLTHAEYDTNKWKRDLCPDEPN